MPDHIHFIIHLEGNVDKPATLSQVVGAYKSIVVVSWLRYIETNKIHAQARIWQNYYYDRIIRDNEELENTRQYIRNNPTKQNQ
jgi:putative transposase